MALGRELRKGKACPVRCRSVEPARIVAGMAHITINDESNRIRYAVVASSTGPFAFNFSVFSAADLDVYVGDTLLASSAYTITLTAGYTGGYPGGSVTLVIAVANTTVTLIRTLAIARTTDFPPAGPLNTSTLNTELDRAFATMQQLSDQLTRAPLLKNTSDHLGVTMADPEAGKYPRWKADLSGLENGPEPAVPTGAFQLASESEARAGELHTVLMTPLRTKQVIEVRDLPVTPQDFNSAAGTGNSTTDTAALLAMAAYATANNRSVFLSVPTHGAYLLDSTIPLLLPGNEAAQGPRWQGILGASIIRAAPGFAGPIMRVRGVPPDGTPVTTTFFRSGYFADFTIDGQADVTTSTLVGIELSGWIGFQWRGLTINGCGFGVVPTILSGYSTNPDYSAASNSDIQGCYFEGNGYAWVDTSLLCCPAMNFNNVYIRNNYNGGMRCLSSHWSIVSSSIAFNGQTAGVVNPGTVYGLQIGVPSLISFIENITLDTIEFDENKTAHIALDMVKSVSIEKCRALFQDVFEPGTNWPRIHMLIATGFGSVVTGVRDRFTKFRVVAPDTVQGYNIVEPNQVVGIDVADYDDQIEAGSGLNVYAGQFVALGHHRANNYRIVHRDGRIMVPGTNDVVRGVAVFAATDAAAVTFALDEPNTNYVITLEPISNNKYWISGKSTTGFQINTDSPISGSVGWSVSRR